MTSEKLELSATETPALLEMKSPPVFFERDFTIRGVSIDKKDIEMLFDLLERRTASARNLEVKAAIDRADPNNLPSANALYIEANDKFRISHTIKDDSERLSITGLDKPELESDHLSTEIRSFWISNRELFETTVGSKPLNYFDIYIDFKRQSLALNLSNDPSASTPNGSCLNVKGNDEQWVIATHQKLVEFFENRKTRWNWLHASGMYDAILFTVIIPFFLWKAYQFETEYIDYIRIDSNVALIGIFIYGFLLYLIFARYLFLFSRWLFPIVEFSSKSRWAPSAYRRIFGVILLGLIIWAVQNVLSGLFW
jgi:hypothetical protein